MNRIAEALRKIVAELTAPLLYHAIVRYRVVQHGSIGARFELQALRRGVWPDAIAVGGVTGVPGAYAKLQPGSVVYVAFADGDPGLPIVLAYARSDDNAAQPVSVLLDAQSGTPGDVAGCPVCYGDAVVVGSTSGVIAQSAPLALADVRIRR